MAPVHGMRMYFRKCRIRKQEMDTRLNGMRKEKGYRRVPYR